MPSLISFKYSKQLTSLNPSTRFQNKYYYIIIFSYLVDRNGSSKATESLMIYAWLKTNVI